MCPCITWDNIVSSFIFFLLSLFCNAREWESRACIRISIISKLNCTAGTLSTSAHVNVFQVLKREKRQRVLHTSSDAFAAGVHFCCSLYSKVIHFTFSNQLPMSHRVLCTECVWKSKQLPSWIDLVCEIALNVWNKIYSRRASCDTYWHTHTYRDGEKKGRTTRKTLNLCRKIINGWLFSLLLQHPHRKMLTGEWYTVQWLSICQRAQQAVFGAFHGFQRMNEERKKWFGRIRETFRFFLFRRRLLLLLLFCNKWKFISVYTPLE